MSEIASDADLQQLARQLGIARMTVYRRMQRYGIESPSRRTDTAE